MGVAMTIDRRLDAEQELMGLRWQSRLHGSSWR
jgi:hypothetical protein